MSWFFWSVLTLVAVALMLAVGAVAHRLWLRYNPFWDRTPEYRDANALAASQARPADPAANRP